MADSARIDDLRRRVQKDPASIAFAQLAEELRRAGQLQESIDACRAGLATHPSYLSARVTLGRALVELNQLDEAAAELDVVLKSAPENLAAMRSMAEIHQRRGDLGAALTLYRAALAIARNDPDLEETVADLSRKLEPKRASESADHLSQNEFLQHLPPAPPKPADVVPPPVAESEAAPAAALSITAPEPGPAAAAPEPPEREEAATPDEIGLTEPDASWDSASQLAPVAASDLMSEPQRIGEPEQTPASNPQEDVERDRATRTIVALEHWLDAIHDARADRRA